MRSISDTLARLRRLNAGDFSPVPAQGTLAELESFGDNPGNLRALVHTPANIAPGRALVVVLHGCTQSASGYDRGSGWSTLAERFGFAVLFPEQQRANNPNLCFNWFAPEDTKRGGGEALSIRQMIEATVVRHALDRTRIFVTGLSAGGAMASAMLATYPELFSGGAIIAGLPYGAAGSMPEAFDRMRGVGYDKRTLTAAVRTASGHSGPWPRVSIWHGTADTTVVPINAEMIIQQWRGLHQVDQPDLVESLRGLQHRVWHDADGRAVIEEHLLSGMSHGTPIATTGGEACGAAGPYMLDVGISSTYRIAAAWGIAPPLAPEVDAGEARHAGSAGVTGRNVAAPFGPARLIDGALRAAGLIKA